MKNIYLIAFLFGGSILAFPSCESGDDDSGADTDTNSDSDTDGTGTLDVAITVGNYANPSPSIPRAIHTVDIIDILHTLYSLKCTTEEIVEGEKDTLEWETIYEGTSELYDSELVISAELPPGEYTGLRIEQSNRLYWVCTDGKNEYEFPDMNNSGAPEDEHILNVFGPDAMYYYDEKGAFVLGTSDERMGTSFTIVEGATTHLTVRTNFDTVDWNDADDNLGWTEGVDRLDNWTTIPGTNTMADFIVE